MRRYIFLIIILLISFVSFAQEISVKSFRALPMDMTASSIEGKRIDQNGQVAALIKVMTTETGFVFEGGTLGIVDTQQRVGEIWVWVPRASRKITILHQRLGGLRDYRYPIEIESERTYEMVLTTAKIVTTVEEEVRQQYLIIQVNPKDAVLEVDDEPKEVSSDGMWQQFVDFGTYTYRVQAPNYHPEAGRVTVDDPNNKAIVTVNLKPNFGWIEVKGVNVQDANVYIDNALIGKAPCRSEALKSGEHSVKIVKGMYKPYTERVTVSDNETTMVSPSLTADFAKVTLKVDADAEIWVNEEKKGIRSWTGDLASGTYRIECRKASHEPTVTTKEITNTMNGETIVLSTPKPIYGSLNVESTPGFAKIFIDGESMGETPNFISQVLIGQHELKLTKDGYADHTENITIAKGERMQVKATLSEKVMNTEFQSNGVSNSSNKGQLIPEGEYVIKLVQNPNFVLSLKDGQVKSGTVVQLCQWKNDNSQKWKVTYKDGKLVIRSVSNNNLVMDIYNAVIRNSSVIQVWEYNGGSNQLWIPERQSNGSYVLMTAANKAFSLDNYGGYVRNGNKIELWDTNKGLAQQWIFEKTSNNNDQQIPEGEYVIKLAQNPNYALSLKDGQVKSGTVVQLCQRKNDNSQKWKVTYKDGKLVIRSVSNNNLVMDIYGAIIRNSSVIQVWEYNGGNNQLWIPERQSNGSYVLMTAANKAYSLDNYGGYVKNGNKIELWDTNKGLAQQWIFEKVGN